MMRDTLTSCCHGRRNMVTGGIRHRSLRGAFIITVLLLTPVCALPQAEHAKYLDQWRWVHFTTESGLPSSRIKTIAELDDGSVWAGTLKGLARFDGYQWQPVGPESGIPLIEISQLAQLSSSRLVAVAGGKAYVGDSSGFHPVALPPNTEGHDNKVISVGAHPDGVSLFLTTSEGLFLCTNDTVRPFLPPAALINDGNRHLWSTSARHLWLNTEAGLFLFDGNTWRRTIEPGETGLGIKHIAESEDGYGLLSIWRSWGRLGTWEWDRSAVPAHQHASDLVVMKTFDVFPGGDAIAAYIGGEIATRRNGVWMSLDPVPSPMISTSFFLYRKNGDLWVCTDHGLFLCRNSLNRWIVRKYSKPDLRNNIQEIMKGSDGTVWLGTLNGIERYRPDGSLESIASINGQPLGEVTAIQEDRRGNVWVASGGGLFDGAYRWDGDSWKHYGAADGLAARRIHKIRKDREGRLWFLGLGLNIADSLDQPGAFRYDGKTFERWDVSRGLLSNRVYAFAEGPDGAYWFGTLNGLSRLSNGNWTHWTAHNGLHGTNRVFGVTVSPENIIWICDQLNGLAYFDTTGTLHYLTTADGLISDEVWDVQCDSLSGLWASSPSGVINVRDGAITAFTMRTGLNSSSVWPILPCGDRVYVGTAGGGLNILDLSERNVPPPRIHIRQPSVDRNRAMFRWQAYAFWGNQSPDEVETRYRLDAGAWSIWSPIHEATQPGLGTGHHRLQVQAKSVFGRYGPEGESITFAVQAPFYQQPVFFVPVGLLLMLVAGLVVTDAMRKKKQEEAIRDSEERHRSVVSTLSEGILILDGAGKIAACNPSAERILETPLVRLRGSSAMGTAWEMIREDGTGLPRNEYPPFMTLTSGRECTDAVIGLRGDNGRIVWLSVNSRSLNSLRSSLRSGVVVSFSDISSRKAMEDALQQERRSLEQRVLEQTAELRMANAELGRAARLKDEFLANMSHELRTPLNAVLGLSASLQEGVYGPLTPQQEQTVRTVEESGRHLLNLVNDVLDLSKIEAGVINLVLAEFPLDDICQESLRIVRESAQRKGLRVAYRNSVSGLTVNADERRVKQILVNLLSNAVKFTQRGEIGLDVDVQPDGHGVCMTVWDTGIGISEDQQKHLYKPFVQLDNRLSRDHSGAGLGLVLVRRMVELHHGSIVVRSTPGAGSRFTVHLPLPPAGGPHEAGGSMQWERRRSSAIVEGRRDRRILIAEDNETNLHLLDDYLNASGFTVDVARTGTEVLNTVLKKKPDVILMDIQMPEIDGLEVTRRLRADPAMRSVRIITITAFAMEEDSAKCFAAGADDHFTKPLNMGDLVRAIDNLLRSKTGQSR
jgi:signal transduction histidine kinase/CheY-like chemotaxis protein/ligand-binding sensor domain-containing protein